MKKTSPAPAEAKRAIAKLGANIKAARIKRDLPMLYIEKNAGITHITLSKVERGEGTVSLAIYAKVLFVLGLIDTLSNLAGPSQDNFEE